MLKKVNFYLLSFMILNVPLASASTDKWELHDANLTARHESTLVVADEALYLLGGRGDKPVEVYNSKNQTWQIALDKTPLELHHFQAVEWQNDIYIVGAFTGKYPNETGIENVLIFDTQTQQLITSTQIPNSRVRGSAAAAVHNDKIYIAGGITDGHMTGSVAWLDEYNPITKTFTSLKDAPIARDHASIAVIDDKLYHIGGRTTSAATGEIFELTIPQIDVYDFNTQTWQTLPPASNIPTPRAGANVTVVENEIWVIGGESGSQTQAHNEVQIFNPVTLEWTVGPKLNLGRHSGGAANYQGTVIVASGSGKRGGRPELGNLEVFKTLKPVQTN